MTRTLKPEDRISRYRIVGPLGAGGMGEVYRAHDASLGRDVALKVLPRHLVRNEERLRRFVLEAKSASSLNHPNIITIYEIGEDQVRSGEGSGDGSSDSTPSPIHFISMELITGETLATKIHQEKTDLKTLSGWLAQAAEGLAKAHAAGIVHRDLKPGNIMISTDGYAKVLDFGLAKLAERQGTDTDLTSAPTEVRDQTAEGVVLGTTGYMSPEQVQGRPADHRSDIFSFGCVLYEAATRHRPFDAETGAERMAKILREKPSPIEELNPEVPAELRRLIRRCLAKNPDQRLDSMKTLALELREIVDEYDALSPSGSSGSGSSAATMAPPRRRWLFPVSLFGSAIMILAAISAGIWGFRRGGASGSDTLAPSMQITTVTNRGDVSAVEISADGKYLAYVSGSPQDTSLWMRQLATGSETQLLPPQKTAPSGLRFSPDGTYLYYISQNLVNTYYNTLFQIPFLGETPRKLASDVDTAITFAPDGRHVCFCRNTPNKKLTALIILDLESGEERTLATAEAPQGFRGAPAWSPDGMRIAEIEFGPGGGNSARIAVFRAEDGRREPFDSDAWWWASGCVWLPDGRGLVIVGNQTLMPVQVWLQPYPRGRARRVTNDWTAYVGASVPNDGAIIASNRYAIVSNLWTVGAAAGSQIRQLTFNSSYASTVSGFDTAPDGSVFLGAMADEHVHLWRIAEGGSEPRPVTSGHGHETGPRALAGGGVVFNQVGKDGTVHVFRVSDDGSDLRQLTAGSGTERLADVSPDGRVVLFVRQDDLSTLWAVPATGGDPTRITSPYRGFAQFSPDGSRILYSDYVQEADGTYRTTWRIIPAAGGAPIATLTLPPQASDVDWAPDGKSLTFLDASDSAANVFRRRIDAEKPEPVTHFTEGRVTGHKWSPDGSRLLLRRHMGRADSLWAVEADGSNPVSLTDFRTGGIFNMDWKPDGRSVVFTYGSQSTDAVLIRNFR